MLQHVLECKGILFKLSLMRTRSTAPADAAVKPASKKKPKEAQDLTDVPMGGKPRKIKAQQTSREVTVKRKKKAAPKAEQLQQKASGIDTALADPTDPAESAAPPIPDAAAGPAAEPDHDEDDVPEEVRCALPCPSVCNLSACQTATSLCMCMSMHGRSQEAHLTVHACPHR